MDPHDLLRSYHFDSENNPTKLQSNKPILPGGILLAPLCNLPKSYEHELESNLSVDVKIIEANHLNDVDDDHGSTRILLKFVITLPTSRKEKLLTMPARIFVRSGFFYKILLKNSLEEHCVYNCSSLIKECENLIFW